MAYTFIPLLNSILGRAGDYVSELRGRFHPTTGHTHDGTAGEGPKITGANVDATWTDWTPTVTQGGSVTVTVDEAKYCIIGEMCRIYAKLTVTVNAGSAPNDIVISGQPAAAQPAVTSIDAGVGCVQDSGTAYYRGILNIVNATSFKLVDTNTRVQIGTNPNFALANGDTITFTATYRV